MQTLRELSKDPDHIKNIIRDLPQENLIELATVPEIEVLAKLYLSENVLPEYCVADLLLSWNFKHILNYQRILGYNSINIREGYKMIEIRSPLEIVYEK